MKNSSIYFLLLVLIFLWFLSCQKEISFENGQSSAGSLLDMNGNCQPVSIGGTYFFGRSLGSSNYIDVSVHVTTAGRYSIKTNTVNGYSFNATGNFADTGSRQVRLIASGKPLSTGNNDLTIVYGNSSCHVSISVLDTANTAVFILAGAPNNCMNDTVTGSFVKASALDSSNSVKISVNVSTAGNYYITTDTVNGYSFSGAGSFTTIGVQSVVLTGTGTPLNSGSNTFTVRAGSSSCTFPVTVFTAITVTNNDHFPLTMNSYWTYDDLYHAGDSVKRTVIDTSTINGNLYEKMQEDIRFGGPLQYFFRKTGSDYYEYGKVDKYTNSFQYANPTYGDIPFLKESLNTGDAWQSPEYSGMASFNQVIILQYTYSCLAADASVVINGNAFAHVYKIRMEPQIRSVGNQYGYTGEIYTYFYAKGVGMVYLKKTVYGFNYAELQLLNWLVN